MTMTAAWTFRIDVKHASRLGELRAMPNLQAAMLENSLWIRGEKLDEKLFHQVAAFADGPVYRLDDHMRMTPFGKSVPIDRFPECEWRPLTDVLQPELPVARSIAFRLRRCALSLTRTINEQEASVLEQEASVLITSWRQFERWASDAPEIRLDVCRFAVCDEDNESGEDGPEVCVVGKPLPPLPGHRFWLAGHIACPLGFHWSPAVDVETLTEVLSRSLPQRDSDMIDATVASLPVKPKAGDLWIWQQNGHLEVLHAASFVPALRTHVRATAREIWADEEHRDVT